LPSPSPMPKQTSRLGQPSSDVLSSPSRSGSVLTGNLGSYVREIRTLSIMSFGTSRRFWYSDPHLPGWLPAQPSALAHRYRPPTTLRSLPVCDRCHIIANKTSGSAITIRRFWRPATILAQGTPFRWRACAVIRPFRPINNSLAFQARNLPLLRLGVDHQRLLSTCMRCVLVRFTPEDLHNAGSALHHAPVHRPLPEWSCPSLNGRSSSSVITNPSPTRTISGSDALTQRKRIHRHLSWYPLFLVSTPWALLTTMCRGRSYSPRSNPVGGRSSLSSFKLQVQSCYYAWSLPVDAEALPPRPPPPPPPFGPKPTA